MKKILNHLRKDWYKYALETLVVIVGILIALAVNNWNEQLKRRGNEIQILKELKHDLQFNEREISDIKEWSTIITRKEDSLIDVLDEGIFDLDIHLELVQFLYNNPNPGLFNNFNTTFKYIENKGFESLSNDSLRLSVTYLYQRRFSNIELRQSLFLRFLQNEYVPIFLNNFHLSEFPPPARPVPTTLNYLRSHKFKNILIRHYELLTYSEENLILCLQELKATIQEIDNELIALQK